MAKRAYEAYETEFDGCKAAVLKDCARDLEAIVLTGFGANLIGLRYKGLELVRKPSSLAELAEAPTRYGNPVLMPPNRISHGLFYFNGREYRFPLTDKTGVHHIHGLVKALPWDVDSIGVEDGSDEAAVLRVSLRSACHPEVTASMPHDFALGLEFRLSGGIFTLVATAENLGEDVMPFALGFHPYFNAPISGGADQSRCFVRCPAAARWELRECFPTGRFVPVTPPYDLRDWTPIEGLRLDDIYTGFTPERERYVLGFEDRGEGVGFTMEASLDYKHWVLFTGPEGSRFICLEPYTAVTNAFNLNMPESVTGASSLEPGQRFSAWWSVAPYEILTRDGGSTCR